MIQNGSGSGVRGESYNGTGGVYLTHHANREGLLAQHVGSAGTGAALKAEGGNNRGVYATTSAAEGVAVYADATTVAPDGGAADYSSRGVESHARGDADIALLFFPVPSAGVFGVNHYDGGSAEAAAGIWGEAYDSFTQALRGINWGAGQGIWATSLNGVGGEFSAPNDYAIVANGDGHVTGDLAVDGSVTAPTSILRVDHPLAPASKFLDHAAVGSSERLNVYSGNATTDGQGTATVRLPAWFGALNADLRYQLTTIGQAAQAWIAAELSDGSFTIATDKPNTKVSWQITGVRADPWAKAHEMDAVVNKPASQDGLYLHPELYGKPADTAIGYRQDPIMDAVRQDGAAKVKQQRQAYDKRTGT